MAEISPIDAKIIKNGIVNIHKKLELRKMHINRFRMGEYCRTCQSICSDLNMQKQTRDFIKKYQW